MQTKKTAKAVFFTVSGLCCRVVFAGKGELAARRPAEHGEGNTDYCFFF